MFTVYYTVQALNGVGSNSSQWDEIKGVVARKLMASKVRFNHNVTFFDSVVFTSSPSAATGLVWIDDVLVYDFQPDALDYVPPINPVDTGIRKAGIQTFLPAWRKASTQAGTGGTGL